MTTAFREHRSHASRDKITNGKSRPIQARIREIEDRV